MWIKPVTKKQVLVSDKATHEMYGEVIAIGNDVKEVKVGNIVAFTKFGFDEVQIMGETVFTLREVDTDLLGIVESDAWTSKM